MSCYDWRGLLAHRLDPSGAEPQGWGEALAHLDGCEPCRSEAIGIDPTLAFRELPAAEVSDSEVESMRLAVKTLRRARMAAPEPPVSSGWRWRAAAAVFLLLTALTVGPEPQRSGTGSEMAGADPGAPPVVAVLPEPVRDFGAPQSVELTRLPIIEEIDRPRARVYQFGSAELAVVLIVDESLDV